MTWDTLSIVGLYVGSAVLPAIGLWGLYRTAVGDTRTYEVAPTSANGEGTTFGQMNVLVDFLSRAALGRPQAAIRDFVFIGSGLLLGAVASIWSVVRPF
ncbi:hypothetical protein QN345_00115 [Cryobacterium sp. 10I1]|uniref:hypothetical protein n=1 Tax=unclassified Cryobacterium TaxID=2649013 RepID=UPI00106D1014|nr:MULTISPECIES: hypothetical protein [unclassified Cryobacterium]MEB0286771.1 hypothetical protein [Cryobacterium sp. 10S3]MEB0303742.1 hypothetical protein [Cryobacterium sp. 10I1]TFC08477.1 hypothetical protein E3O59_08470 [Cryobacterium sp. MDB2-33-2]WPX12679.1 hypothetical protein RHM57_13465 [Cryobacterium sp. 10S3]